MIKALKQDVIETVFSKGQDFFDSLISDINNATQSIILETYIFYKDTLGEHIANALINAAKRGVEVKLLVDGAGTPSWGSSLTRAMEKANIKTRVFHPFPWQIWQWSRSVVKVPWILKGIYLMLKMNSRNHRKVCIIDNKITYVGSMNISQTHLNEENGGQNWRDTGVKLIGANLKTLKDAFEAAWDHIPIQERIQEFFKHINTNPQFRLNNTRHRRRLLYKNLLRRIARCKKRIWITNAYFVPDNFLLKKLRDAAQKGADVRIILPHKSDVFIMPWASTTFYRNLLKAGVRIFEYLPVMLHSKTLILDDWMIVGSSNMNHRSLLHDLEVDVNLKTKEAKTTIENQFLEDIKNSNEIKLKGWQKRPLYQRTFGRAFLYIKYWI